jgi:non-homologous end joining protein Ku
MGARTNLVRKQYLVSEDNIKKIQELARIEGTSAAEIVRQAIDAYDPNKVEDMDAPELIQLVSNRLKEAIAATKHANRKVSRVLKTLNQQKA